MINPVVFQGNAVDSQGNVLSGATISVISVTTGLPVLLYSDLADTGMTNPFNTNASGEFVFYCEAETVNVTATKGASSRTWENQFLNVVSLKNDLKTNAQTVSAPWTFAVPTYMQSPLNMSTGIPISFGSVSVLNGTYNSIPTLKVNNIELLTKNTLSSANNIVDTDRAVNNVGWWAIAQENLGTAAFANLTTSPTDITAGRAVSVDNFQNAEVLGLGVRVILKNDSLSSVSSGAIVDGSTGDLDLTKITAAGVIEGAGAATLTGTWKNVAGRTLLAGEFGEFLRVT